MNNLVFGDFNGDKKTDVFWVDPLAKKWKISKSGTGNERVLNNLEHLFSNLKFGDLDGDGKTDVLRVIGTDWFLSSGGSSPLIRINSDFDGTIGN